jgi:hypothetical protein
LRSFAAAQDDGTEGAFAELRLAHLVNNDAMRNAILLALALFAAAPLAAQMDPELRDLEDAQAELNKLQHQLMPVLRSVEQEARTLGVIVKAWRDLGDNQPRFAIDTATASLDDFVEREEKTGTPIPKELMRYVTLTRSAIEKARITASDADIANTREYLHHDVIHPLQQQVLTNVQKTMSFNEAVQRTSDLVARAIAMSLGAAQSAARK